KSTPEFPDIFQERKLRISSNRQSDSRLRRHHRISYRIRRQNLLFYFRFPQRRVDGGRQNSTASSSAVVPAYCRESVAIGSRKLQEGLRFCRCRKLRSQRLPNSRRSRNSPSTSRCVPAPC